MPRHQFYYCNNFSLKLMGPCMAVSPSAGHKMVHYGYYIWEYVYEREKPKSAIIAFIVLEDVVEGAVLSNMFAGFMSRWIIFDF